MVGPHLGAPPHPAAGWSQWRGYNKPGAKGVHPPPTGCPPACLAGATPSLQASQGAGHRWLGTFRALGVRGEGSPGISLTVVLPCHDVLKELSTRYPAMQPGTTSPCDPPGAPGTP